MNKILEKVREIIQPKSELNKPEINTNKKEPNKEPNKVRRNKWGYPVFVKSNAINIVKKIR